MPECVRCLETTRQQWHKAFAETTLCPPQAAGYECGWCGMWYGREDMPMVQCDDNQLRRMYSRPDIAEWRDYHAKEQLSDQEWLVRFGVGEDEPNDVETPT